MIGIARHHNSGASAFDGTTECLFSDPSSDSYTGQTICCWLTQDYSGGRKGIMGRMFGATNGWCMFVDENKKLNYHILTSVTGIAMATSVEKVDLSNWTFVAATYNQSQVGTEMKLWIGDAPENLHQIGEFSATGFFSELGVRPIAFGNVLAGAEFHLGAMSGWNGNCDQFGIWYEGFTLEELKYVMTCGTRYKPLSTKLICDVNGTDPETGVTVSLGLANFAVVGTEVVQGYGIGCKSVPAHDPFYRHYIWMLPPAFPPPPVYPPGEPPPEDDGDIEDKGFACVDVV